MVEHIVSDPLGVGTPTREAIDGQPTAVRIAVSADVAFVKKNHGSETRWRGDAIKGFDVRVNFPGR